jgi:hypothetical protein
MKAAHFNKTNYFKTKYADMNAVLEAVRKPLAEQGLAITQTTEVRDGTFCLVTRLGHSSGQWLAGEFPLPPPGKSHEIGSAMTYAKRYSLSAIAGVSADEDEDGQASQDSGKVAAIPKRENPHTVKPEDTGVYEHRIDPATGEVLDCIPVHLHRAQKLMPSKPETRVVAEDLLKRMRANKTAGELVTFAELTAEEWAALPDKWLGHYQAEYQMLLDSLRKQQKAA